MELDIYSTEAGCWNVSQESRPPELVTSLAL